MLVLRLAVCFVRAITHVDVVVVAAAVVVAVVVVLLLFCFFPYGLLCNTHAGLKVESEYSGTKISLVCLLNHEYTNSAATCPPVPHPLGGTCAGIEGYPQLGAGSDV